MRRQYVYNRQHDNIMITIGVYYKHPIVSRAYKTVSFNTLQR